MWRVPQRRSWPILKAGLKFKKINKTQEGGKLLHGLFLFKFKIKVSNTLGRGLYFYCKCLKLLNSIDMEEKLKILELELFLLHGGALSRYSWRDVCCF